MKRIKKKAQDRPEEIVDGATEAVNNIVNNITESLAKVYDALGVFDHFGDTHKVNGADEIISRLKDLEIEANDIYGDWLQISDPDVPDKEDYLGI